MTVVIADSTWLILLLYMGFLALSLREKYLGVIGSLIGVVFGFTLLTDVGTWLGIVMIFTNIYLFYHFLFNEAKE